MKRSRKPPAGSGPGKPRRPRKVTSPEERLRAAEARIVRISSLTAPSARQEDQLLALQRQASGLRALVDVNRRQLPLFPELFEDGGR